MALKVSDVARLAGVTVRALHHYDEIGLVRPSARSAAGYRLYAPEDEEEAKEKWGGSEAYAESARRTSKYKKEDWAKIRADGDGIFQELTRLLNEHRPPTSTEAMELAECHRKHIERWLYQCPPAMHAGLGELYVSDERFRESLDRYGPGLAEYARAAWRANAERKRT